MRHMWNGLTRAPIAGMLAGVIMVLCPLIMWAAAPSSNGLAGEASYTLVRHGAIGHDPGLVLAAAESSSGSITWGRAVQFIGRFHVLFIHFPIALLLVGAFADMLALVSGREWFASSSRFCVVLGAPSAVIAASLGWAASMSANYTEALNEVLALHRFVGTVAAASALVTLGLLAVTHRSTNPLPGILYRFSLYSGSMIIGFTAHLGGSLIYGTEYLFS